MADKSSDPIVALALLKTSFDLHRTGYVDNFNRLTAECLRQMESDVVTAPEVQSRFISIFGLRVPLNVVQALLVRATKRGLLVRDHRALRINREALKSDDFAASRTRAIEMQGQLIEDLVAYVHEHFHKDWSAEQAEASLQQYLGSNLLPLFRSTTTHSLLRVPRSAAAEDRYILASYVNHIIGTKSAHFESLRTVVEGTMLANAILLPAPEEATRKFKNTSVFFDTRVLLRVLGYAGPHLQAASVELLDILYETGADLRVFAHTVHELQAVLRGCARLLAGDRSVPIGAGETYDYFQRQRFSSSDVFLLTERVEDNLKARRIEVAATPPRDSYSIDEQALEEAITTQVSYSNKNALMRDINSISAVIRLRKDWRGANLEESRAIFVTLNGGLRRAANDFYKGEDGGDPAPVAVSDWVLANLLWLKRPNAASELSRKRIVADFYAAIQPNDEFRRRYLEEIDKLQQSGGATAAEVYILAHSLEARASAYDKSLGDDEALTHATVVEVLESVRAEIEAEALQRAEAAEERALRAEAHAAVAGEQALSASSKVTAADLELANAKALREAAEIASQTLQAREVARRAAQLRRAEQAASVVSYFPFAIGVAAVTAAVFLTLPFLPEPVASAVMWTATIFIAGLTLVGTFWGVTVSGMRRTLEVRLFAPLLSLPAMARWRAARRLTTHSSRRAGACWPGAEAPPAILTWAASRRLHEHLSCGAR